MNSVILTDIDHTTHHNTDDYTSFWANLSKHWDALYELIYSDEKMNTIDVESNRTRAIELINGLLSEKLFEHVQIEMSWGQINSTAFKEASKLVELYISPRLLRENIPYMEKLYSKKISLNNLQVFKYKRYHNKDPLIADIAFPDYTVSYNDIGCQSSIGYDAESKSNVNISDNIGRSSNVSKSNISNPNISKSNSAKPMINIVIYVKAPLCNKLLLKKKVNFKTANETITENKWLPDSTAIDLLLLNIIGEYNFIHHVGYIDFIPEGDPLIAPGSVFVELETLKDDIKVVEKLIGNTITCHTCERSQMQCDLLQCSKCKKTKYCSSLCQKIDYPSHKSRCCII
jgi:hypothetical protein